MNFNVQIKNLMLHKQAHQLKKLNSVLRMDMNCSLRGQLDLHSVVLDLVCEALLQLILIWSHFENYSKD